MMVLVVSVTFEIDIVNCSIVNCWYGGIGSGIIDDDDVMMMTEWYIAHWLQYSVLFYCCCYDLMQLLRTLFVPVLVIVDVNGDGDTLPVGIVMPLFIDVVTVLVLLLITLPVDTDDDACLFRYCW